MIVSSGRRARLQRPAKRSRLIEKTKICYHAWLNRCPPCTPAPAKLSSSGIKLQLNSRIRSHAVPGISDSSHLRIRLQHLKRSSISFTMFKQLTTTLMLTLMLVLVLVLDPTIAHVASPSFQLLRAGGRQLEAESVNSSNSSTNATNPLYEYNTSIKGCKGIQYFFFWSCCGWNSC